MLHRSFKPAKCKTALKLAASRIKLLKNKREAQVKQLKRELAQLLESGQDQTARIRVEHLVREEKTMAAYDLVEIYCELIVARLPIIESQKNCPIDLKEAVASMIFASPRCADIPELMDIRKHFTAKYGKEFVTAAVEIRPDCGVSRLLVEKLSAKAPDGPTKLKILTEIAEEHNIKWDPKSFGEKDFKPVEDLLNGPNTFEQSRKFQVGQPNVQGSANRADMGAHNYHVPSQHYVKHDVPANSHDPDLRSPPHSQNFLHRDMGSNKTMPLGDSHPNPRPSGTGRGEVEHRHSYPGDRSGPTSSTQSWNIEFKDATSAAQAAAESAERASMAARAAAELSSQGRITRQQSTESLKGSFVSRDEGARNHTGSKIQGEQFAKDRPSSTFYKKNPEMHCDQSHGNEQDDMAGLTERFNNLKSSSKSGQTALSKSSSASVDDYHSTNEPQMSDRHSRKSSSELQRSSSFGETCVNQESSESEVDFVDEVEGGMGSENVGYFEDASIRKQASSISLNSHSRTFSDDPNLFSNTSQQKSNEKIDKDLFMVDDERIQRDAKEANSHDNPLVFDDSGSENDEFMFDVEDKNNGQERYSYFPSEDGKPSSHLLANANAWGPTQNIDESKSSSQTLSASEKPLNAFFSEDLTSDPVSSQLHDLLPVTFDESDGSDTENEVELDTSGSEVVHSSSTGVFPDLPHSGNAHVIGSSHDSKTGKVFSEETQGIGANVETDSKFAYGKLYMAQTSPIDLKSGSSSDNLKDNLQTLGRSSVEGNVQSYQTPITANDVEPIEESSLETGTELNFGVLTGGLRNKGYRRPPYTRNLPDNPLPEQERTRQSPSSKVDISSRARDQESYNQLVHTKVDKKTSSKTPVRSSDSDDSDEELLQQKFSSSQESYSRKPAVEANERLRAKAYFDSHNSDSEEVISKKNSTGKTRSGTGFSRRTKASPSSFNSHSSSQATVVSKSSVTAEDVLERKSSSGSSYATETQEKQQPPTRSSDYRGSFGQHRSRGQAASKRIQQSKRSSHEDSSSRSPYATDVQRSPLSQSKGVDYWASSGQRRSSEPAAPKPVPESKKSLHEENLKSSTQEQPFNPPPKTVATFNTRNSKTSSSHGETQSTENPINKASHVHPKLPDYDTFAAHLLSLRQNRQ